MDTNQETLYAMALTRISHFSLGTILKLYRELGSATAVMEHRHDIHDIVPEATPRLAKALDDVSSAIRRAEDEMRFDEAHGIRPIVMNSNEYPERMRNCDDAPLVLYYRGTANLNQRRIVAIVGTRHCTIYGQDIIRKFVHELKELCHDTIIVSGLAYGVDINAHRSSLDNGLETIGVLAHGLDYLYPSSHRDTATKMLTHGGLITEFMTSTNADKMNFVRRNRIIAGLADATILVESARKGGGLITANIAQAYGRSVFAFPGNVGMPYSEGCNSLIRGNGAGLITCAKEFVEDMGWTEDQKLADAKKSGIERQLFPELNADETKVVNVLARNNNLQSNVIATQSGLAISATSAALFSLELKGVLKMMAGGIYHLID